MVEDEHGAILAPSWGKGFPFAVASNLAESFDDSDLARLPRGAGAPTWLACHEARAYALGCSVFVANMASKRHCKIYTCTWSFSASADSDDPGLHLQGVRADSNGSPLL